MHKSGTRHLQIAHSLFEHLGENKPETAIAELRRVGELK
jgi:hypothetical protein